MATRLPVRRRPSARQLDMFAGNRTPELNAALEGLRKTMSAVPAAEQRRRARAVRAINRNVEGYVGLGDERH